MAKPVIRILVACKSSFSRKGLCDVLSKEKDLKIIKEVTTEDDLIKWIKKGSPDIILLCFQFLLECGSDVVLKIKSSIRKTKIVVFNYTFSKEQEAFLFAKGVVGVIGQDTTIPIIMNALRKIHSGRHWFSKESMQFEMISNPNSNGIKSLIDDAPSLTQREREVLAYIAAGYKNHEISERLQISKPTIKTHINNIYRKLNVNDRLQATLCAVKYNLVDKK